MFNATTCDVASAPLGFYETLGNVGFIGDFPEPTPNFIAVLEADVDEASATAISAPRRDANGEVVLCSCMSACGSNYSSGSCSCMSSCGSNYSRNGDCECMSHCGSNSNRG
ncbi:MAG: hypothetical protein IJ991_12735 [Thermoguttaceae bacterium]|nr:hypothetical protein [Thermoguttaceae bacterium]